MTKIRMNSWISNKLDTFLLYDPAYVIRVCNEMLGHLVPFWGPHQEVTGDAAQSFTEGNKIRLRTHYGVSETWSITALSSVLTLLDLTFFDSPSSEICPLKLYYDTWIEEREKEHELHGRRRLPPPPTRDSLSGFTPCWVRYTQK